MTSTDAVLWAFVAVLFVLGLALVASRWPVWAKAGLVALVTGLYFWSDTALEDVWGWPSRHALPEKFVLLAAVIEEPSKGKEGALYVWVNAIENGKPTGSLVVVKAETIEEARQIAENDPYAKAGLFASVEVKAWNWVFNNPEA